MHIAPSYRASADVQLSIRHQVVGRAARRTPSIADTHPPNPSPQASPPSNEPAADTVTVREELLHPQTDKAVHHHKPKHGDDDKVKAEHDDDGKVKAEHHHKAKGKHHHKAEHDDDGKVKAEHHHKAKGKHHHKAEHDDDGKVKADHHHKAKGKHHHKAEHDDGDKVKAKHHHKPKHGHDDHVKADHHHKPEHGHGDKIKAEHHHKSRSERAGNASPPQLIPFNEGPAASRTIVAYARLLTVYNGLPDLGAPRFDAIA